MEIAERLLSLDGGRGSAGGVRPPGAERTAERGVDQTATGGFSNQRFISLKLRVDADRSSDWTRGSVASVCVHVCVLMRVCVCYGIQLSDSPSNAEITRTKRRNQRGHALQQQMRRSRLF